MLLVSSPALATQVLSYDLGTMTDRAAVVVWGTVTSAVSDRMPEAQGRIHTRVTIQIKELIKDDGRLKGGDITISVPGGRVGKIGQWIPGAPRFAKGMEVVVLLNRHQVSGRLTLLGLSQGRYVVERPAGAPATVVSDRTGLGLVIRDAEGRLKPAPASQQLDRRPLVDALKLIRARVTLHEP